MESYVLGTKLHVGLLTFTPTLWVCMDQSELWTQLVWVQNPHYSPLYVFVPSNPILVHVLQINLSQTFFKEKGYCSLINKSI